MSKIKLPEPTDPSKLIRPEYLDKQPDLKIKCVFGHKILHMVLSNPGGQTTADLAKTICKEMGIPPDKQRIMFKGIICDPPDMGVWAPLLSDLGLRNGDHVEVTTTTRTHSESGDNVNELKKTENRIRCLEKQRAQMASCLDGISRGMCRDGQSVMALVGVKKQLEDIKSKFLLESQALNSLTFHPGDCVNQANRRVWVERVQKEIDKCTDAADMILASLAMSKSVANLGTQYPAVPDANRPRIM